VKQRQAQEFAQRTQGSYYAAESAEKAQQQAAGMVLWWQCGVRGVRGARMRQARRWRGAQVANAGGILQRWRRAAARTRRGSA